MADVFISYASEDVDRARRLAHALQARGWSVWWDRHILAGQTFDEAIERELNAAKSVVTLWSSHSIASEWVRNEATFAAERGVLVPAMIERVALPLEFRRKQTADLADWDGTDTHEGFQSLCRGIAAATQTAGMAPSTTPAPPASLVRSRRLAGMAAALVVLAAVAYWVWPDPEFAPTPGPASPEAGAPSAGQAAASLAGGPASPSVSAVIDADVVLVRWTGRSVWLPDHGVEARNELRLPVSFQRVAGPSTVVRRVRVLLDSSSTVSTWDAVFQADDTPLAPYAPVDQEIRAHRTSWSPFELSERNSFITRTIDFVPIDHPSALGLGTHVLTLQVQQDAARQWSTAARAAFTIPEDFALDGTGPTGAAFSRYDYWQVFPLSER